MEAGWAVCVVEILYSSCWLAQFSAKLILKAWVFSLRCAVLSRLDLSDSLRPLWTVAPQAPLSMGILQATILGWVAMPSSRGGVLFNRCQIIGTTQI